MEKAKSKLSQFSKFLDPFLVLGIFILFTIPIITLFNLTPGHTTPPPEQKNVLGLTDQSTVTVTANTTASDGITVEKSVQTSESSYNLQVLMLPHEQGTHQNTLFTAINGTDNEVTLNITSGFEGVAAGTKISVVIDDVSFIVLDTDGTTYPPSIYIMPGDSAVASIEIESPRDVNFATGFNLDLAIE